MKLTLYNFDMKPVAKVDLPLHILEILKVNRKVVLPIPGDIRPSLIDESRPQLGEMKDLEIFARNVEVLGHISDTGVSPYFRALLVKDESAARAFAASQNKSLD